MSQALPRRSETGVPVDSSRPAEPLLGSLGDAASRQRRRCALFWILAGCCCFSIDVPVARFFMGDRLPEEMNLLLERGETFGHGYGVLAIAITVGVVDVSCRSRAARLLLGALGAGLLADVLKVSLLRTRPRYHDLTLGPFASFEGLWCWNTSDSWHMMFDKTQQSFPSAHTATAVGLAVGLATLYPHARKWFYTLAFLVVMNRITGCAHFVSDACLGTSLGFLAADWAGSDHRTINWLDQLTGRWWGVPLRQVDAGAARDHFPVIYPPTELPAPTEPLSPIDWAVDNNHK